MNASDIFGMLRLSRACFEGIYQVDDLPKGYCMHNRHIAVVVAFSVCVACEGIYKLSDHIVYVHQVHYDAAVVDRDGQVLGDIMAEGCNRAVVVRAAPFAEDIREAVNQHLCSGILRVLEQQVFSGFLDLP